MSSSRLLALTGAAVLCIYLLGSERAEIKKEPAPENTAPMTEIPAETEEIKPVAEVYITQEPVTPANTPQPESEEGAEETETTFFIASDAEKPIETTISGGLAINNQTEYPIDALQVLLSGTTVTLLPDEPQILIIHTHSSEAYTPAGLDRYEESDICRTEDERYNIIRVGDELERCLKNAGLNVIHDRGIYDYPSYTGSYGRTSDAISYYLREHPGISVVFDVHRDALGAGDTVYKTVAEEEGTCASQVMLLVGTDESGLEHPGWRDNLSLAVYLQNAVTTAHPTLMRPIAVVPQRYNQQYTPGSLIIEVGSSGNTLQEALAAARLFGNTAGEALARLVEK